MSARLVQIGLIPLTPDFMLNATRVSVTSNGARKEWSRDVNATPSDVLVSAWLIQAVQELSGVIGKSGPGLISLSIAGAVAGAEISISYSNKDDVKIDLTEFSLGNLLIERDLQNIEKKILKTVLSHVMPADGEMVKNALPLLITKT